MGETAFILTVYPTRVSIIVSPLPVNAYEEVYPKGTI